jgi:hypothetical protein
LRFHFLTTPFWIFLFMISVSNLNAQEIMTDVAFKGKSIKLNPKAKQQLDSFASAYKGDSSVCFSLKVPYSDLCDKCGIRYWDRIQTIADYLIRKGVSSKCISMDALHFGTNIVRIQIYLPDTAAPAPHPYLKSRSQSNSNSKCNFIYCKIL